MITRILLTEERLLLLQVLPSVHVIYYRDAYTRGTFGVVFVAKLLMLHFFFLQYPHTIRAGW